MRSLTRSAKAKGCRCVCSTCYADTFADPSGLPMSELPVQTPEHAPMRSERPLARTNLRQFLSPPPLARTNLRQFLSPPPLARIRSRLSHEKPKGRGASGKPRSRRLTEDNRHLNRCKTHPNPNPPHKPIPPLRRLTLAIHPAAATRTATISVSLSIGPAVLEIGHSAKGFAEARATTATKLDVSVPDHRRRLRRRGRAQLYRAIESRSEGPWPIPRPARMENLSRMSLSKRRSGQN